MIWHLEKSCYIFISLSTYVLCLQSYCTYVFIFGPDSLKKLLGTHLFAIHTWKKVPNLQDFQSWCETQLLHPHFTVAWSIKGNFPRCTVVCIDLLACQYMSVHVHAVQTQSHMQIDHHNASPQFSFDIKRKLLIKPYIWNRHLHIFSVLWWLVFLCNRQNIVLSCFPSLNSSVALSLCFFLYSCLFGRECCLSCALRQGASGGPWTQGRHSLPSSAGWGREGGARPFQSLPAHYMPQIAAFLSPLPI